MVQNEIYLPQVGSTNRWLQEQLTSQQNPSCDPLNPAYHLDGPWVQAPLPEGTLVYTSYQTSGRGQLTNVWESDADKNILCSLLLYPTFLPLSQQFLLSQAVALAVIDVLSDYAPYFSVKWPNDIYWKDKKIAGILIENTLEGKIIAYSIVGIGLNINQVEFKSDAPNPVSLYQILGQITSLDLVRNQLWKALNKRYAQVSTAPEQLKKDYLDHLYRYEQMARYQDANGVYMGKIIGVEEAGYLHIQDTQGQDRRYAFKEVSYLW